MPTELAVRIAALWPDGEGSRFAVCTGDEPLLRLDPPLIEALHGRGFEIAIETNGTLLPPPGIDWVCVSPKAGADLVVTSGDELKAVVPQPRLDPLQFAHLDFRRFSVHPTDDRVWAWRAALKIRNGRSASASPTRNGS